MAPFRPTTWSFGKLQRVLRKAFCSFSVNDTYFLQRSYLILCTTAGLRKYDGQLKKGIPEDSMHKCCSRSLASLLSFLYLFGIIFITATSCAPSSKQGAKLRAMLLGACWWLWDEEGSRVTICDTCDFGINVPTRARDRAWITLVPKFVAYTVL